MSLALSTILIGNAVSLAGEVCGIISGVHKTKTLYWHTARLIVSGISNVILGSWLAFWLNVTGAGRNILTYKVGLSTTSRVVIALVTLAGSLFFFTNDEHSPQFITEVFTTIACIIYTLLMTSDDVRLKWLTIGTTLPWLLYGWFLQNYVASIFAAITVISCFIGIWRIHFHKVNFKPNLNF